MDVDELNQNNVVPILGSRSLKKKKTEKKLRANEDATQVYQLPQISKQAKFHSIMKMITRLECIGNFNSGDAN